MASLDPWEFAAIAAHELRAPLRHVRRLLEAAGALLAEGGVASAAAAIDGARQGAARMDGLLDQLAAHASASAAPLSFAPVDLAALARDVGARARAQWAEEAPMPALAIEVTHRALGDAALVELALENLVANALRFSAGRPGAAARVSSRAEDGAVVAIDVEDNGPGFDGAQSHRLFRPFERLAAHGDGLGLGLAIVALVAARHGGSAAAALRPEGGARFTLRLPLAYDRNGLASPPGAVSGSWPK